MAKIFRSSVINAQKVFISLFASTVIFFCGYITAGAVPFTTFEKNVEAMTEATLMSTSKIVQEFGLSISMLSFSGIFDNSSWSMSMTGTYLDMFLNLSFSGSFNESIDEGNFVSTGTLDTAMWDSSGTWSFIDIDSETIGMLWNSKAIIEPVAGKKKKPDKHFTEPKKWAKTEDDTHIFITDYGKYFDTEDGKKIGKEKEQISDWVIPKDGPQIASITTNLVQDNIFLIGFADFDNGTASGTINVVPEPATMLLFGTGLAALFGIGRKRLFKG